MRWNARTAAGAQPSAPAMDFRSRAAPPPTANAVMLRKCCFGLGLPSSKCLGKNNIFFVLQGCGGDVGGVKTDVKLGGPRQGRGYYIS